MSIQLQLAIPLFVAAAALILVAILRKYLKIEVVVVCLALIGMGVLSLTAPNLFETGMLPEQVTELSESDTSSIVLAQQFHTGCQLGICCFGCVAENNCAGTFNLVVEKFAEVFHIHFAFVYIHHCCNCVQLNVSLNIHNSCDNIAQFANAGWFYHNAVRAVIPDYLFQRFAKITYQAAADTAGIHFCNVYTGILQKTAVDAYIAKFIFNQHQLFAAVCFGNKFLYKCCFTCAKKA